MNDARTNALSCAETVPFPRGPHVYFLRHGNAVKIGFSANLSKRLPGIQTSHHETLTILGFLPEDGSTERAYHQRFEHLRIRGEWFRAEPELLQAIFEECSKPMAPQPPDYETLSREFVRATRKSMKEHPANSRLIAAQTNVGFWLQMLANGETPERLAGLRDAMRILSAV